jgi:hypothetical protein
MPAKSPMTDDLKLCRPCSTWKMHDQFAKDARIKSGLAAKCKNCNKRGAAKHRGNNPGLNARQVAEWRKLNPEYMKEYYDSNRQTIIERTIDSFRVKTYGLTPGQYDEMVEAQNNLCAICEQPETAIMPSGFVRSLAVDHCHKTGKVRQLLCGKCNTGIGNFLDNPELLKAAISYLEKHK